MASDQHDGPAPDTTERKPLPDLMGCVWEVLRVEHHLAEGLPLIEELVGKIEAARGRLNARWELASGIFGEEYAEPAPLDLAPSNVCKGLDDLTARLLELAKRAAAD